MPAGKRKRRPTNAPIDAYSIEEFCERHGIGVSTYYALRKAHRAPREMRIGRRWLISKEAAADWRRAQEVIRDGSAAVP